MDRKIAFVFSGQGAQYAGMGRDLFEKSPVASDIFRSIDKICPGTLDMCFSGSKEELMLTVNSQKCIFAVDLACAYVLDNLGVRCDGCAGFSLGEVAALSFGEFLPLEQCTELVAERAALMAEECKNYPSSMAAVLKLDEKTVVELVKKYSDVFAVNFNCPDQIVVSGCKDSLAGFRDEVKALKGRYIELPVQGGFHSPFMKKASLALKEYLSKLSFKNIKFSVYSNKTALPYEQNAIVDLLSAQISSPVLWQRTIENMVIDGFDTFIECGPGQTLCNFIKKINSNINVYNVETYADALKIAEDLK